VIKISSKQRRNLYPKVKGIRALRYNGISPNNFTAHRITERMLLIFITLLLLFTFLYVTLGHKFPSPFGANYNHNRLGAISVRGTYAHTTIGTVYFNIFYNMY